MRSWLIALGMCAALAVPPAAVAQNLAQGLNLPIPDFDTSLPRPQPKANEAPQNPERFNHPVYNPETKSYFEIYAPRGAIYDTEEQHNWMAAKAIAQSRIYKGVRGQLAVVKTKETNDFIVKHLQPVCCTWIGLQYLCDVQTLRWVTGEFWPLTGYQNWARTWNLDGAFWNGTNRSTCFNGAMGVHYWGRDGGYKWNANGTQKKFGWMIIEYPTGKP